jgi:hypothetical protein
MAGMVYSFTGKHVVARKLSKLLYEEIVQSPGFAALSHHKLLFPTNKMASPIFVHPNVIRPNKYSPSSSSSNGNKDDYVYFVDNFVCDGHGAGKQDGF